MASPAWRAVVRIHMTRNSSRSSVRAATSVASVGQSHNCARFGRAAVHNHHSVTRCHGTSSLVSSNNLKHSDELGGADEDLFARIIVSRQTHVPSVASYNSALQQLLDKHNSARDNPVAFKEVSEKVESLMRMMNTDWGKRLTPGTYRVLLDNCATIPDLKTLLEHLINSNHRSNALCTAVMNAYVRVLEKSLESGADWTEVYKGDIAMAVVQAVKHMALQGCSIDGTAATNMLHHFVEGGLRVCMDTLYWLMSKDRRRPWEALHPDILVRLIRLCGINAMERKRRGSHSFSKTLYKRAHSLHKGWKPSRLCGQIWYHLEIQSQKIYNSYPTLAAHQTLLLTACKRGDSSLIEEAFELMHRRYPAEADTAATRSLLLKGCVIAGEPEVGLKYARTVCPTVTLSLEDCSQLMQTINRLSGYQYLYAISRECWGHLGKHPAADMEDKQIRLQWLQARVMERCARIVRSETLRQNQHACVLPIPVTVQPIQCFDTMVMLQDVRLLIHDDDLESSLSNITLPFKPGCVLINEDDDNVDSKTSDNVESKDKKRFSPLHKTIRAEYYRGLKHNKTGTYAKNSRRKKKSAVFEASPIDLSSEEMSLDSEKSDTDKEEVEHLGCDPLDIAEETVNIVFGSYRPSVMFLFNRGWEGGNHGEHLFVLQPHPDGSFTLQNGEKCAEPVDLMQLYDGAADKRARQELCVELGCMLHGNPDFFNAENKV
eukprot:m.141851 g.141851  ORF g.141851 m.141851 type:complete len:716 (-) comp14863_c0_seq4:2839-4986(-)